MSAKAASQAGAQLTVAQTIVAPTITLRGQYREPPPSKSGASSSKDGSSKTRGIWDKDGKTYGGKDKDKDEDKDPPTGARSAKTGGPGKDDDPEASDEHPPSDPEPEDPGLGAGRYADGDGRGKARSREADEVEILTFPLGSRWRAWRANTIQSIISAAGRQDDLAFPWIMRCETDEPSGLHDPGEGWVALDRKMTAALAKIAHGEIGRELTQMTAMSLNSGQIVRGPVLVALVFRYYALGSSGQVLYDLSHLQSLRMKDNNLESLHNAWNMVMRELATSPDPVTEQFWYYNQIKDFKPLSKDIGHYRRAQWNQSPDY